MSVPVEMDAVNTIQEEKVQDIPPVPIKTYKWEDIRREKERGLYPYTYLSKEPYSGEVDPSEFRMDTLRPSKSASVLEKSSSGVNIQDVTNNKDDHSGKDYLDVSAANEGIVETADSSVEDNVSQYLDRDEDDLPVITEHVETPGPSKMETMDVDDRQEQRAKSEEPKRKRKLSIESSYSRISLSKLGVMKKLREAKDKLKLPRFSFSKSESKLDIPKKTKKESKKSTKKDQSEKSDLKTCTQPKKDQAPVYIHIPLKPPPGQTDEFSYLEFEERNSDTISKPTSSALEKSEEEQNKDGGSSPLPGEQESVQFIILTAPSDDERLDDNVILPESPSSDANKFFDNTKLKGFKKKECVDQIPEDMPIEGIIFEDVIQVEYVDEHNRPIGTTERSNILEITEENLPNIEKKLSNRNLAKELEKEIASSMDSLNKIARQNTLKKLKEQHKAKSSETLKKPKDEKQRTQEAPELRMPLPPANKSGKNEEIKLEENKDIVPPIEEGKIPQAEEKKDVPPIADEEIPKPSVEEDKNKAMYDEEDGLQLTAPAVQLINEEFAKEKLPETTEEELKAAAKSGSIKKKVSFKRRSKQEDPDGIYEDVRVTSDGKNVDGKEQQTKELKVMEQSMSVDEEKTYLDDKIMKTTSLEEDYNKWSKLTDHEYEPVNPPVENEKSQLPTTQVQSSDVPTKRTGSKHSKKSPSNSIRIPLKDEDTVQSDEEIDSADVLTAEEMQARIENEFFNNTPASQPPEGYATPITTTVTAISTKESEPQESQAKKFQEAFKTQAGKIRTKFKNIQKPNIHMPQRPNLERFKIQKPKITMPKIPDQMRVNLPSFTLPKRGSGKKRPVKQYSTESNVGDSKKKFFDFSTYPRIFGKKKKTDDLDEDDLDESSTVPRVKKISKKRTDDSGKAKESKKKSSPDVIRIPLHSEESMDKEENGLSSRGRYEEENIDMDDAYLRESQQMHTTASAFNANDFGRNRWNHGSFHRHNLDEIPSNESEMKVTDLDNEAERPQTSPEPELEPELEREPRQTDTRSASSSGDVHGPGVLEKINSDEYFMQMGNYLSAEIREAFQQPTNPLAKLQNDDSFDREFDVSDQSIQEVPKRRPIKKPKRKKTPNVSKERISYDQESEPDEYQKPSDEQPARPKRRSKQKKKGKDDRPPYQETIFVPEPEFEVMRKAASDNILLSDKMADDNFHDGHFKAEYRKLYENEKMQGIEQPNILISDPYRKEEFQYNENNMDFDRYDNDLPQAPPRKQRSLKSLASEHDSIIDEINYRNQNLPRENIESYKLEHEYIIPTPEEPPIRPARTRSRTRSQSRATNQPDDEPSSCMEQEVPCVEEPCVQQTCDYMGYAIIDKNKQKEPPLPAPTRRKRSTNSTKSETKFFTVPRPLKEEAPVRPVRNYSTLVPKSKRSSSNLCDDEKENADLGQYIEIDDDSDHSRLQSGDVVQKMKDRPLPAPPRPPRKSKDSDKDAPFKDITHKSNVDDEESINEKLEEAEVSVQTEPLPDDLVCEELVQEKGDKIITPSVKKTHPPITEFENVETVTHGALVVAPVAGDFQEGPITTFSRSTEKIITVRREVDDDDATSDVPAGFKSLKEPEAKVIERIIERPVQPNSEVEVLKAQKLQVSDLDVDRLMVNELLASKIKVSEIDSDSISVAEINPKSGNLIIGGFELPINFFQEIMERMAKAQGSNENQTGSQQSAESAGDEAQTKGSIPSKKEDVKLPSQEDQSPSKVDISLDLNKDEESLPSKNEEIIEDSSKTSPDIEKKLPSEAESELSPTTLKTTIEYLDELIREENINLNLEERIERMEQGDLESTIESPSQIPTKGTPTEPVDETKALSKQSSSEGKCESVNLEEVPPLIPDTSDEDRLIEELKTTSQEQKKTPFEERLDDPPKRPPRQSDTHRLQQSLEEIFIPSQVIENSQNLLFSEATPPPRPPDPEERLYLRSQPPASFYTLRSPTLDDFIDEDIPMPPRRKRPPRPPSRSSSEEAPPATARSRRHRTPEPSIPQLTGQLTRACATAGERAFKRLIKHITMNVLRNADGRQDLHVMILILLILIAGLILLGNGGNPVVHHYHWEYFNPPKDL